MSSNGIVLNSTKYANTQKVVAGTYTVLTDDSVLLCDTSVSPVVINLLQIPNNGGYTVQGNWSTQYKLYIVDYKNNASANNITIVAPSGFKINAAQMVSVTNNGDSVIVEITSNLDYIAIGAFNALIPTFPFFTATKTLVNAGTNYIPKSTNYSVRNSQPIVAYDQKTEVGLFTGTFDLVTGIWTCPADGFYNFGIFVYVQINQDANNPQDSNGYYWMQNSLSVFPVGVGSFSTAILGVPTSTGFRCSDVEAITQNTSDIMLSAAAMNQPAKTGQQFLVYVLNRTDHDVIGLGVGTIGNPRVVFSVQKIA